MQLLLKRWLRTLAIMACTAMVLVACEGQNAPTPTPGSEAAVPAAGVEEALRVAVDPTFPPFVGYDARRQIAGFDVDVMKAVAGRAGLPVKFVPVARDQLLNGVLTCDYDAAISAIAMTDALRRQITFSKPYATVSEVLVVKKGNIKVKDRDSLAEMTVGVQDGSPSATEVLSVNDAQPLLYPSVSAVFQDLIAGYIDAAIVDQPLALRYVRIPANNLKIAGEPFGGEDYAIALCNRRAQLVQQVNDGLAAIETDGTLDKLQQKWFGNR